MTLTAETVIRFVDRCVGFANIDAFSRWAFGSKYQTSKIEHLPRHWNERHGDLFVLKGTGRIETDVERMTLAWITAGAPGAAAPIPDPLAVPTPPTWRGPAARTLYVGLIVVFLCFVIWLCWIGFNPNV